MGKITVGTRSYTVNNIPHNYSINFPVKVRKESELKLVQIFADLLIRGYELIKNKEVPTKLHEHEIRFDILEKGDIHDDNVQKSYLKEKRKYFEERYSMSDLVWMSDFHYAMRELEGKVSSNWFALYEIVRGDLPSDFPLTISFAEVTENILERKASKHIDNVINTYFERHPERIPQVAQGEVPKDVELNPDIGLTEKTYIKDAKSRTKADKEELDK